MLINVPNILTFSRIIAIPVLICLLLFVDDPLGSWLAFSAYTVACITDF
ncbi:MAG: CDP-diacylglycerol--glycerol-3-phosphate 3-phosphatidyltransferase, partial [Rhodospirillales bacterium]|nr:CDP-diacylglycerol--glycerol-3-phosphate 3-phosphatidyltransferase [Rhodospirillales bacterium]